ncbi:hypothetical protein G9A89_006563 [Geosiphon pyriformis]|nr:hypothetical protein G9A89_006563 [Geosiphon pyriformis]
MRNSFTLITLSCGGAVIAAGILAEMNPDLGWLDVLISLLESFLMFYLAKPVAMLLGKILLQTTPNMAVLSLEICLREIEHHPSIIAIIAVHVWQNSYNHLVGTLSIRVKADANEQAVLAHVYQRLGPLLDIGNTSPVFRNARISIGELTVQISFLYAYQIFFLNQAYTEHQILIKEAIMGSRGTDKVLEKIQEALDRQNYYEAHQMYRTVCRRLIKQKQYSKAIDLLYTGARSLLEHKQSGSATDLSLYMIDAYSEGELPVTDESRDRLIQLMKLFPYDEPGRKRFFDTAIGWSVKFGESPAGDPELHHCVAKLFWKDKIYQEAESHFLAGTSESSAAYGQMLGEWAAQDQPHKCGAYLARAVLQYLCLRNIHDAKIAFNSFEAAISAKHVGQNIFSGTSSYRQTVNGDSIELPIYNIPLLNFLQFLILTVQRDASDLFVTLRNKYKSELEIEPTFEDLLNRIGEVFFNIRTQRPQQFNILQDLMSSLFSSGGSSGNSSAIVGSSPFSGASGNSSTSGNNRSSYSELD